MLQKGRDSNVQIGVSSQMKEVNSSEELGNEEQETNKSLYIKEWLLIVL